jgi:flagellar secretion chaperone FliS
MQSYHYKQLQAYQQARMHVGKAQQVILLYDGMIRFLQQAQNAEHMRDIGQRFTVVNKAMSIVMGLQSCLDMENYPEISAMLYDYYETLYIRMNALHHGASEEDYTSLIADIKQMRDAWASTEAQERAASVTVATQPPQMDMVMNVNTLVQAQPQPVAFSA